VAVWSSLQPIWVLGGTHLALEADAEVSGGRSNYRGTWVRRVLKKDRPVQDASDVNIPRQCHPLGLSTVYSRTLSTPLPYHSAFPGTEEGTTFCSGERTFTGQAKPKLTAW